MLHVSNFIHRLSTCLFYFQVFFSLSFSFLSTTRTPIFESNQQALLVPNTRYDFDSSVITINMAADQLQHNGTKFVIDPEPLTGLNIVTDTTANGQVSEKPIALAEVDHNLVSNMDSNASVDRESKSKKVVVVEPNNDFSDVVENLEIAVPKGEEKENELDDDIDGTNVQMESGDKKKKKKKRKPKSKRGLVRTISFHSQRKTLLMQAQSVEQSNRLRGVLC